MNFEAALSAMKQGYKVERRGWNGKGQYVELQRPDTNSKMTLPYAFITTSQKDKVPWICSQTDMLAEDWEYVPITPNTVDPLVPL